MKTPDEIKKGLEMCKVGVDCALCPYSMSECADNQLETDAFNYIKSLELDIAERDELCEFLRDKAMQFDAQVPRWISVEDEQKPKHHEEVLCRYVFDGDSECFYAVLTYYAYGDNGYVTGQHFMGEGLHDMRVTHWMPLPEPPKEEK